jgi:uncharacterized membrane protein
VNDRQLDLVIARILRVGVGLSAAIVAAGGAWYLAASADARPPFGHFGGLPGIRGLAALPAPEVVILAGLLLLIATPVARVVFSLAAFAMEKDWAYVGITAIVLGVLAYSILTGL